MLELRPESFPLFFGHIQGGIHQSKELTVGNACASSPKYQGRKPYSRPSRLAFPNQNHQRSPTWWENRRCVETESDESAVA